MRKYLWFLFALAVIGDIVLATWTWQDVRSMIGWVKHIPQQTEFKLRHIVQYTPQAILLGFCLEQFSMSLMKRSIIVVLGITAIGILTEVIQYFIPTRIPAIMDVFWNFSAALLGGVLYFLFRKYKNIT